MSSIPVSLSDLEGSLLLFETLDSHTSGYVAHVDYGIFMYKSENLYMACNFNYHIKTESRVKFTVTVNVHNIGNSVR